MALLDTRGVCKSFGGVQAVAGVDMQVSEGEIVSVIGPNGAGKTSFFNLVTGLYSPDSGEILFEGQSIVGLQSSDITEAGIARTFQNVRLFLNMTVIENVMVAQHCRTRAGAFRAILRTPFLRREEAQIKARAEDILAFFGSRLVGYRIDQPAFSLSYANRRRLEIARAMATEPRLLLLDEPVAGMNPRETVELTALIRKLRDEWGLTVVVIEHDMRVVRDVSDRVIVLDHGVKIAEGSYDEVSSDEAVIEAYLGRPWEPDS
ncbi:MAG: ABC transporter ATP-binding protein [bacterium]|nr:ABC transporter ATP-binding protein [bacterium]MDE0288573.1 ABC transporter ATP-binding protein [bacterium]MDE0437738.1 ABC transporter ATP-binding protein [bacterium]